MSSDNAHDALLAELEKHEAGLNLDSMEMPSVGSVKAQLERKKTRPPIAEQPPEEPPAQAAGGKVAAAPPRVDTSKPLGWSPPPTPAPSKPVDAELEGAQADAADRRSTASVGQAVSDFVERPTNALDYAMRLGGGGVSAPAPRSSVWKDYGAEGDRALADLSDRRKSEGELSTREAAQAKAAKAQDPKSDTAQTYRMVLQKFAPDLQLDNATPEQMEKIAPWLEKFAAENADALKARAVKPADPLAREKLDEEKRHNRATEGTAGARVAAKGQHAAPTPIAKAGDYSSVPEDVRETVKAIVEGRAAAPEAGSRFGAKILNYVTQIDPAFDSTKYGSYKGVKEKLSKSDEIAAITTARNHLARAESNIPDNFDAQSLNRIKQAFQTGAGADSLTPFETDVKIAADELAKAYGNNSEAGRSTIEHLLAPAQSKAQLRARLAEARELLTGKLSASQGQLDAVAPKTGSGLKLGGEGKEGRIHVTNGKETLEIDPSDVSAAEADGFRVVR